MCAGRSCGRSKRDRFLLCVLQRAAAHACVILFLNLWLQIAVEWLHHCCHLLLPCASRDAGDRHVISRDAANTLQWQHECCMSVVVGRKPAGSLGTKPCVFPCKEAAAGDDRYLACAAIIVSLIRFAWSLFSREGDALCKLCSAK